MTGPAVDSTLFKDGMRRLAASVCLITTTREGGVRNGLTATAVCSLSADPATLLCCLNRASHSFAAIAEAKVFCVNVLSVEDAGVAHHFAGERPADEKFLAGVWRTQSTGAPVLSTALASFDCWLEQVVEVGTHGILIGRVADVTLSQPAARPLLYAQGGYGQFTREDAAATINAS